MSPMELHIIKFLMPCRNLQLWPMVPFNLSVIKLTAHPKSFTGRLAFQSLNFSSDSFLCFLQNINILLEHSAPVQTIPLKKNTKHIKMRFHLLNLTWESFSSVIQLTIPHKPQLIFRAAQVLSLVSNGFYYLFQAELLYGMACPFLFPFVGKRKATVLCQSERSHVLK